MFIRILLLIFCLSISNAATAQLSFKAVASKSKLGVNQRLKVSYEINQQGADNFQAPNFQNFTVISGPSSSVSQSWVNGKSSFSKKYIYILQPKRIGNFKIPPATIEYNGKQIKTNILTINVSAKVEMPDDPNDPAYVAKNGVRLVTEISKSNLYLGEAVFVKYKLYVKNTVGVSDIKLSGLPQFPGFWNQQIESQNQRFVRSSYKGQNDYYALDLYKVVLIPQKSGKLEIEPAEIKMDLNIPTGKGDFFGNMISNRYRHVASSPKRTVRVKNLPEEGKPDDFTGAVGQFNFNVIRSKNILKANEASEIKIMVSGTGNMKLFELPKPSFPSGIEVFTPENSEQLTTTYQGLKGSVSDSYTIVPQYKGKYKIPGISFSFFNPNIGKYQTIQKNELFIEAVEGKPKPESLTSDNMSSDQKNNITQKNTFAFIALKTKLIQKNNKTDFFGSTAYYLLISLLLLTIPVVVFVKKQLDQKAKDVTGNKQKRANKLAKKYLREAEKAMSNNDQFFIALEKALHNFLKAKLKIETSDISKEKIMRLLVDRKVPKPDAEEFILLFDRCDFARYSPSTLSMIETEYEKALKVISKIDKFL